MRLHSLFSALLATLVVVASVSAATQRHTVSRDLDAEVEKDADCDIDGLIQNSFHGAFQSGDKLNPENISVLNWNIYKGKRENWATDFKRYSYRHDVVTIQEAHLGAELKSVLNGEHPHWTLNAAFNYRNGATGVMTASSIKPIFACGQRTLEPVIRTPKTSLISYYPVAGMDELLLVANIHSVNFSLGVEAYREQIAGLFDLLKEHQGPIVLAGDFNTWSDQRMQIVQNLAKRLSLASLDYTNHNRTSVFGNALDHVFYRGLEPVEHDTWHVTSSDHNPTRVSFRVKNYYLTADGIAANEIDENNC